MAPASNWPIGGYIDDVFLLGWVFGAAVNELSPYLEDPQDEDRELQ